MFLLAVIPARGQQLKSHPCQVQGLDGKWYTAACVGSNLPGTRPVPHTAWYFVPPREVKHTFAEMARFRNLDRGAFEYGFAGAYASDLVTTAQDFQRRPHDYEGGPFCHGSRNMACISAESAGVAVAVLVIAHVLLDHGKRHWYKDAAAAALLGYLSGAEAHQAWRNSQR
jgi:hypothetical protein